MYLHNRLKIKIIFFQKIKDLDFILLIKYFVTWFY